METIAALQNKPVAEISLDYDLDYTDGDNKGLQVMDWMLWAVQRGWHPPVIHIHSANPLGAAQMVNVWREIEEIDNPLPTHPPPRRRRRR
jgi:hypothetical protein